MSCTSKHSLRKVEHLKSFCQKVTIYLYVRSFPFPHDFVLKYLKRKLLPIQKFTKASLNPLVGGNDFKDIVDKVISKMIFRNLTFWK